MTVDLERARALFDGDELRWIVDRLRARIERGWRLDGPLRLDAPTEGQREALARLLGRRPRPSRSVSAHPAELARVLARAGIAPDLPSLVEALQGPLRDRVGEAVADREAWQALHRRLRKGTAAIAPALARWVDEVEATGLLRRLGGDAEGAGRLTSDALAVLARLPAVPVPLKHLAATAARDSHALDDGSPLATLVLGALEALTGLPRRDRSAQERRALWARAGVLVDELGAPALALGLRPAGDGLLARTLRAHAEAGEPSRITLRQLVRHPVEWRSLGRSVVAVCENPTVVAAAADRLGSSCPPLVCTDGQPSGAVQALLAELQGAGLALRFHADFDRGGLRIGNLLADRFGALPWRMSRRDYEGAADLGRPLASQPEEASWDAGLAAAMRERGRAVEEEQVLEVMLGDLACRPW